MSQDIKNALDRAPQEEVDLRNQRIKRAIDLSSKKQYLPYDMQAKQTPYASYLSVRPHL
jgi:ubiquinol-cytochrome c reductase subunit 7